MAKQSKKIIGERIAQIEGMGFKKDEGNPHYIFRMEGSKPHIFIYQDDIEQRKPEAWVSLMEEVGNNLEGKAPKEIHFAVETEDVTPEATGKVIPLDGEKLSQQELVKLDINVARLNEWKEKYAAVKITSFEDKENYALVKEGKKLSKTARITLEKTRVMLVAPLVQAQKAINDKTKGYAAIIADIENPMDQQLEQWDEWEKEDEKRKEEEKQRVLNERVDKLQAAGMHFSGSFYVIGATISMDIASIKAFTDTDFDFFIEKVKLEKIRLDKEEEERVAAQKAEDERKAREQQELKEKQDLLDKQQQEQADAAKKLEDEKAAMRQERLQMREQMAHNAGLTFNPAALAYEFENKYTKQAITKEQMEAMESPEFSELIKNMSAIIKTAKDNAEAAGKREQEQRDMIANRELQLKAIGMVNSGENGYYFPSGIYTRLNLNAITCGHSVIADAPDSGWQKIIETYINTISERKSLYSNYDVRKVQLQNMGFTWEQPVGWQLRSDNFGQNYLICDVGNDTALLRPENEWAEVLTEAQGAKDKFYTWVKRTESRLLYCAEIGLERTDKGYEIKGSGRGLTVNTVCTSTPEDWDKLVAEIKTEKQRIDEEEAEKEKTYNNRVDFLINLGMKKEGVFLHYQNQFGDKYTFDLRTIDRETPNDKWVALADNAKDTIAEYKQLEATKLREVEEAREKAKPELEQVQKYLVRVVEIYPPRVGNEKLRKVIENYAVQLSTITSQAMSAVAELSK